MQDNLKPPADLGDTRAVQQWAQRVVTFFDERGNTHGVDRAQQVLAALQGDPPLTDQARDAVGEVCIALMIDGLKEARDTYSRLIGPTEELLAGVEAGSEDHAQVSQALAIYKEVVELFELAAAAIQTGGPDGQRDMEQALSEVKERLRNSDSEI